MGFRAPVGKAELQDSMDDFAGARDAISSAHKEMISMQVTINGKDTPLPENPARTIDSLLEELEVHQRLYVTVELNGEVLDREGHGKTPVSNGDTIEFLYFMGGGR
jgi:sulfur carrier protein